MKKFYIFIVLLACMTGVFAQGITALQKRFAAAKTNKDRIQALDDIANHYMMNGNADSLADVYGNKQIKIAAGSHDNYLITWAQFLNGRRWMSYGGVNDNERLKKAENFLQNALTLSRQYGKTELEANTCILLSIYYRQQRIHRLDKATDYINMAQSVLAANANDSLSVMASRSAAGIYQIKGDQLNAFRNYNNALSNAERIGAPSLIAETYISLGNFYITLEDYDKALNYLIKSYRLLEGERLINDEKSIGILAQIGSVYIYKKQYEQARQYFMQMHKKAKQLGMHEILVNQPLFYVQASYLEEKNYKELLRYSNNQKLLKIIKQYKQEYLLDWYKGAAFEQQNRPDSAGYYYKKVLQPAAELAPPSTIIAIYTAYGFFQIKNKQAASGLQWMEKAHEAGKQANRLSLLTYVYHNLDSAYAIAGNKSKAYDYRVLYDKFNDSLKNQSKSKQLTLAEINAEGQRLKIQQQKEDEALRKKHNLQYLGITAAIASVFVLLVLTGFFTTSAAIIRGIGFFAFIFFFEFITLLCDHVIHNWTHGEPLKIMAIKILFVAMLLPLHHFVEEKVIHHLIHRKKIRLGKLAILKRSKRSEAVNP